MPCSGPLEMRPLWILIFLIAVVCLRDPRITLQRDDSLIVEFFFYQSDRLRAICNIP